jgi:hypothetical protein
MTMTIGSLYFLVSNRKDFCSLDCQLSVNDKLAQIFFPSAGPSVVSPSRCMAWRSAARASSMMRSNRGITQRPLIVVFGILQDFLFTVRLIEREMLLLFQLADFQRALGPLVKKADQLAVELVDATPQIGEGGHAVASMHPASEKQISRFPAPARQNRTCRGPWFARLDERWGRRHRHGLMAPPRCDARGRPGRPL